MSNIFSDRNSVEINCLCTGDKTKNILQSVHELRTDLEKMIIVEEKSV